MHYVFPIRRILVVTVLLAASTVQAAGDRMESLGEQLICMCRSAEGGCGQLLAGCNMVGCPTSEPMRRELKRYADEGRTDGEILSAFSRKYGPRVLSAPPFDGWFNGLAWVTPLGAFCVGGIAVAAFLKRGSRPRHDENRAVNGKDYENEVEQELRRLTPED